MFLAEPPPVVAIDGPAASGKGSVARAVASRLDFHCLDSGSLYRAAALHALRSDIPGAASERFLDSLAALNDSAWAALLADPELRMERVSVHASAVSAVPAVRGQLLERQRACRRPPGLVAEGRDMGTVVFPDAALKVYLTADVEVRAHRRVAQLKESGEDARIAAVLADLHERDRRDSEREAAPLAQAPDARVLDNSKLDLEAAADLVCGWLGES